MEAARFDQVVSITAIDAVIEGRLVLPAKAIGIVAFAHGSGSSRHSPRNNYVASVLHQAQIGTLLLDLLTPQEDEQYANRFDIALLTQRLLAALAWLKREKRSRSSCAARPPMIGVASSVMIPVAASVMYAHSW